VRNCTDWMLPGVAPTGKYVEVPLVAIVCFRGDKLYNEHIYWDQASVLVQLGLIDRAGLPVVGIESAQKLLNEHLPSNPISRSCVKQNSISSTIRSEPMVREIGIVLVSAEFANRK